MRSRSSREQRLGVEAGRDPLEQRQQQRRAAQVAVDRLGDARVLHLDDDLFAVERGRAMHLADRGGGQRALVERREHAARAAPPSSSRISFSSLANGTGGTSSRSVASLDSSSVALLVRQPVELDHRQQLPDLHRRAAHPAQLVDELADEVGGPLVAGGRGALGRAHAVGGAHPRPAQPLPRHQPADPRRPRDPPGRQPPGLGRRRLVAHATDVVVAPRFDRRSSSHAATTPPIAPKRWPCHETPGVGTSPNSSVVP